MLGFDLQIFTFGLISVQIGIQRSGTAGKSPASLILTLAGGAGSRGPPAGAGGAEHVPAGESPDQLRLRT